MMLNNFLISFYDEKKRQGRASPMISGDTGIDQWMNTLFSTILIPMKSIWDILSDLKLFFF